MTIDTHGPTLSTGAASEQAPATSRTLRFNEPLDPAIGVGSGLTLSGPGGVDVPVTVVTGSGSQFAVTFNKVVTPGAYVLAGGATIRDLAGNVALGAFQDSFTLVADATAPTITSLTPVGPRNINVSTLRVSFSESMLPASFTTADIGLIGPIGQISPTSVTAVAGSDDRVFDVAFPT